MILSDRTLREAIAAGRIVIDPFDESTVQPSSIDVRVDGLFRTFRNHTAAVIDVKQDMSELTELVEIPPEGVFMLHPGEFVLGSTLERVAVPDDLVARIEGKALSIATPIPTPTGWCTIGDLRVGDRVFAGNGTPTRVKDATEVMLGRPCSEVEFSDGSILVADEEHEWVTTTAVDRGRHRRPSVRTTRAIAHTLRIAGEPNHRVPVAGPVAAGGRGQADAQEREVLLDGLLACGCEFTTTDERLAEQVHELAASLGLVPMITKRAAVHEGIERGPEFGVTLRSEDHRSIVDIRSIASVPVRCIEVDHPGGVFLAGRAFIPTHNSSLGRLGLLIHSTAGFIDAGFEGHITLELANVASLPITIYPGMKIGQLSFMDMTTPAEHPYGRGARGSKYQGQRGPTPSRYWENFR